MNGMPSSCASLSSVLSISALLRTSTQSPTLCFELFIFMIAMDSRAQRISARWYQFCTISVPTYNCFAVPILLICHGKQKMNKHYNSRRALTHRPCLSSVAAYLPWWSPLPRRTSHGENAPRQAAIARFLIATQILELSVSYRKQTTAPHSNRYFFRLFRIPPAHLNRPAPITNPNCRPPLRSSGRTNDSAALCIREVAPSRTAKFP